MIGGMPTNRLQVHHVQPGDPGIGHGITVGTPVVDRPRPSLGKAMKNHQWAAEKKLHAEHPDSSVEDSSEASVGASNLLFLRRRVLDVLSLYIDSSFWIKALFCKRGSDARELAFSELSFQHVTFNF